MKNIKFIICVLFFTNSVHAQDHTSYNNLMSLANKMMVAERYEEASVIFKATRNEFADLYKSIDLFYWALSEAEIGHELIAYDILLDASKINNDGHDISAEINDEPNFVFLSEKQLKEIKAVERKIKLKKLNEELVLKIAYIDSVDAYWEYYIDSVVKFEVDEAILSQNKNLYERNMLVNKNLFITFLIENGYPDFMETNAVMLNYLQRTTVADWKKIDKALLLALKKGFLSPADYAYSYFLVHKVDKFHAAEYMQYVGEDDQNKRIQMKEMGNIGMGM
ncbi:hypothetical protein DNU06_10515 [Putridiphycobacter roseus]|uniref:Uncharacterized protein n=1 Tax=Putridiphycobacter roseus TaxID=2219161 RepID=A0A2W1NCR1_9FLAO|nr:hypothetical protein [Putridiphycobacter roseus]PZE17165.1 hypothetical protein DNU06_10515 [Putridiphycobacter roseus]